MKAYMYVELLDMTKEELVNLQHSLKRNLILTEMAMKERQKYEVENNIRTTRKKR